MSFQRIATEELADLWNTSSADNFAATAGKIMSKLFFL